MKEINENDRLLVGIREWAMELAMRFAKESSWQNCGIDNLIHLAVKVEAFVSRGIIGK